jgi:hypothetical protein
MKKVVTLSILITILTSCNSTGDQTSAIIKSIDTITEVSQKKEIKDELEPDLSTILSDFKEMANKTFIEDTVLVINNDSFSISLKHYPLPDSPVVVPKTYVGIYELDSFTAPNFKSSVTITQGGKTILQREISKNDFREFLDTPTNNYAVLLYPYVSSENNHIELHYSISVPLTDVGIGVGAKVDKNGDIKFELR